MFSERFVLGLLVAGLLLAVAHWFPWPQRLHRLLAYACGVAALLAGQLIWLGATPTWWGLALFAVIGGLVTGACYLVDWLLNLWVRSRVAES